MYFIIWLIVFILSKVSFEVSYIFVSIKWKIVKTLMCKKKKKGGGCDPINYFISVPSQDLDF